MKPFFDVLLDIAVHFGIERLESEWQVLCEEPETDTRLVKSRVTRIFTNIRRGYELART